MNMGQAGEFDGAKVALFLGDKLIVILRDDFPGLPFAGYWDLPGGGREADETPFACVARECREELGLCLIEADIAWSQLFPSAADSARLSWFFVAHLPADAAAQVRFGEEGQRWTLMRPDTFIAHPKAVPAFQARLKMWLENKGPPQCERGEGDEP